MTADDVIQDLLHDLPHRRRTATTWLHNRYPGTVVWIDRVTWPTSLLEEHDYVRFRVEGLTGDIVVEFGLTLLAFTAVRPADLPAVLRRPLTAALLRPEYLYVASRDGRLHEFPR